MTNTRALSSLFGPEHIEAQARDVIAVLNDLIALIEIENHELARGMPASLASTLGDKTRLAALLEAWVTAIRNGDVSFEGVDERVKLEMAARAKILTEIMQDNTTRILAAMEASRRRISAIMQAVRDQHAVPRGYGASGLVTNRTDAIANRAGGLA